MSLLITLYSVDPNIILYSQVLFYKLQLSKNIDHAKIGCNYFFCKQKMHIIKKPFYSGGLVYLLFLQQQKLVIAM